MSVRQPARDAGQPTAPSADSTWDPVDRAVDNWARHGWGDTERLRASLSVARVERIMRDQARAVLEEFRLTHARHEALGLLFFSRHGQLQLRQFGLRLMLHP